MFFTEPRHRRSLSNVGLPGHPFQLTDPLSVDVSEPTLVGLVEAIIFQSISRTCAIDDRG